MIRVSANLKTLRKKAGLSQNQLARLSNLDRRTISKAENNGFVQKSTLQKIAFALRETLSTDISISDIMSEDKFYSSGSIEHVAPKNFSSSVYNDLYIDLSEHNTKAALANRIPDQNDILKFGVSNGSRIKLIPTLNEKNDFDTIEALRSELLSKDGPFDYLSKRYTNKANTPQATLYKPLLDGYTRELSKDPKDINYAILFAKGSRIYSARQKAAKEVEAGEWPDLDIKESSAVDDICSLHGPLIMASSVGRKLVSDAYEFETTPQKHREEEKIIEIFGDALSEQTDIFEPDTIEAIKDITSTISNDTQPARTRGMKIVFAGSALVALVGGAAWYSAGGIAVTVGSAIGGAFVWEVAKKTDRFKSATDNIATRADIVISKAEAHADPYQKKLLELISNFVIRRSDIFNNISNIRPEFSWVKQYLKDKNSIIEHGNVSRKSKNDHFELVTSIGIFGIDTLEVLEISNALARIIGVKSIDFRREVSVLIDDRFGSADKVSPQDWNNTARDALKEIDSRPPAIIDVSFAYDILDNVWASSKVDIQQVYITRGAPMPRGFTDRMPMKSAFEIVNFSPDRFPEVTAEIIFTFFSNQPTILSIK